MKQLLALLAMIAVVPIASCQTAAGGEVRTPVTAVNKQPVDSGEWWLDWQRDAIAGGRDGCNEWHYRNASSPIVIANSQECPPDPRRLAYWRIVEANRAGLSPQGAKRELRAGSESLTLAER